MALCTDSELRDGEVVGDPTEGALLVLAEKGGIDVTALRGSKPRVLEVPFDSETTSSWPPSTAGPTATAARWSAASSRAPRTCWLGRADRYLGGTDVLAVRRRRCATRYERGNSELAGQGMRVLAVGSQDFSGRPSSSPSTTRRTCSTG